jgi:hypothetical protein
MLDGVLATEFSSDIQDKGCFVRVQIPSIQIPNDPDLESGWAAHHIRSMFDGGPSVGPRVYLETQPEVEAGTPVAVSDGWGWYLFEAIGCFLSISINVRTVW